MHEGKGRGRGRDAAEELILRVVAEHAESLLRAARQHSICPDDAQDAYQRTLEIFMARADRLDPARVVGWLHVVVKHEAQAICRSRKKLLGAAEIDPDSQEARRLPSLDDRVVSKDVVSRAAEALQRLKPQELRAVWLKAEGHSYNEIAALTGWSYTKVNRCLTEGRRRFLERFEAIESGAECERWLPIISAVVDGEASQAQVLELRPHLRNCPACRATLKALRNSSAPLSAVLAVPLGTVAAADGEQITSVFMRAYETIAGGFHERAVHSFTKAQTAIETAASGKVAAVAASAAAAAGSGYATVEKTVTGGQRERAPKVARHEPRATAATRRVRQTSGPSSIVAAAPLTERRVATPAAVKPSKSSSVPSAQASSEFSPGAGTQQTRAAASPPTATTLSHASAPPASGRPSDATATPYATSAGAAEFAP